MSISTPPLVTTRNLVVFDTKVPDWEQLRDGLTPGTEALILDPDRDGVEQISEALAGYQDLASVHIISHGEPNRVFSGNSALDVVSAATTYSEALEGWQNSLAPGADLLLYGCNVGAEATASLPQVLAHLTGADVAVSEDLTGAASLGGDWDLEVKTGQIEALPVFNEIVRAEYTHVLAGVITTVAGADTQGFSGDGGAATSAQLSGPVGVVIDSSGNLYISDYNNNRIRKVDTSGNISSTVAGTLNRPIGVAIDSGGNLYIADYNNHRIRKVDISGNISTVAGTTRGFSGDGGAATSAQLNSPQSVEIDSSGNLYIADSSNHRIRKVDINGNISTVAGTSTSGFSGDGGAATSAQLNFPQGVEIDSSGNLYIADYNNHRIRKVDISGNISTVAGTTRGFSGDGGAATSAQLNRPTGVEIDGSGNLYISDNTNNRIRKVDISGNISTVAGTGTGGFSGDGGAATSAQLNRPTDVEIDGSGNLYIADTNNHRIRKVAPPPTVNLSVSATSGTEAATTAITVTATTSAAVTSDETVTLAVSGTGITAGDYTLSGTTLSGTTLTIPSGIATGTATFTVVDDALAEVTETATLTISNPSSGLTLGTTTTQDITITDNDKGVVFSKTTATATEGGATDSYTIKLNTVPTNPVTVTLNTGNQLEDVTALTFNADATALNAQTVTLRGLLNK